MGAFLAIDPQARVCKKKKEKEIMSNPSKKKRKASFLSKLRGAFKGKDDEFEEQTGSYRQKETSTSRRSNDLTSASDENLVSRATERSETCATTTTTTTTITTKSDLSGKENRNDKNLMDIPQEKTCENVPPARSENLKSNVVEKDECCNVTEDQKQESPKLGSDRHMNTKIAFLERETVNVNVTLRSCPRDTAIDSKSQSAGATQTRTNSKTATLVSPSSNASVRNDSRKFLVKETKAISQESSEDSDFSADSTEDSYGDASSEDETDRPFRSEKILQYFKDEYFTKGKYITYFFLEMERQFYNPSEVYSMVQYHLTDCEKPEKEGIRMIHETYTYIRCLYIIYTI